MSDETRGDGGAQDQAPESEPLAAASGSGGPPASRPDAPVEEAAPTRTGGVPGGLPHVPYTPYGTPGPAAAGQPGPAPGPPLHPESHVPQPPYGAQAPVGGYPGQMPPQAQTPQTPPYGSPAQPPYAAGGAGHPYGASPAYGPPAHSPYPPGGAYPYGSPQHYGAHPQPPYGAHPQAYGGPAPQPPYGPHPQQPHGVPGYPQAWGQPTGAGGGWAPPGSGQWGAWPANWPPVPPRTRSKAWQKIVGVAAIVLILAGAVFVGHSLGTSNQASVGGASSGGTSSGTSGSSGGSGIGNVPSPGTSSSIAAQVDPGVVDVNTKLSYQGAEAAGTGIVIDASGIVLTNNHVVDGATTINVTAVGTGRTYGATVLGTDASEDVALIKLQGASGLQTVKLGDSNSVTIGQAVVAIGNAGGIGGTPSVSSGDVTALGQSIQAQDEATGASEQLSGLIQHDATLQPGDSGGPLVDMTGKVVGIDTAASTGFDLQGGGGAGFAIPINQAMSIARQIEAGQGSSTVHIGATAFLGVEVNASSSGSGGVSGAVVQGVIPNSPAEQAGIAAGDVITSLDGKPVHSPSDLTQLMGSHHPGDSAKVGWVDATGHSHTASVQLTTGPTG